MRIPMSPHMLNQVRTEGEDADQMYLVRTLRSIGRKWIQTPPERPKQKTLHAVTLWPLLPAPATLTDESEAWCFFRFLAHWAALGWYNRACHPNWRINVSVKSSFKPLLPRNSCYYFIFCVLCIFGWEDVVALCFSYFQDQFCHCLECYTVTELRWYSNNSKNL